MVLKKILTFLVAALAVPVIVLVYMKHILATFHQRAYSARDHFATSDHVALPMAEYTLSIEELLGKQWMADLQDYLRKIPPGSLVSLVSSDYNYQSMLLNWLISATINTTPPLSHILVLSLDRRLHATLVKHGFDSVYVDAKELLNRSVLVKRAGHSSRTLFVVMVLRLTVMRLMNHWGYDAANYDTDAIILQNPEELYYNDFKSSDLIGSRGTFPTSVRNVFGLALCAGVFMIKSTPKSEWFWSIASEMKKSKMNDQRRLNTALMKMHLKWIGIMDNETWVGKSANGFTVSILQSTQICRRGTCKLGEMPLVYVWHHGKSQEGGNQEIAEQDGTWYLRADWKMAQNSSAQGVQWLQEMLNAMQ